VNPTGMSIALMMLDGIDFSCTKEVGKDFANVNFASEGRSDLIGIMIITKNEYPVYPFVIQPISINLVGGPIKEQPMANAEDFSFYYDGIAFLPFDEQSVPFNPTDNYINKIMTNAILTLMENDEVNSEYKKMTGKAYLRQFDFQGVNPSG